MQQLTARQTQFINEYLVDNNAKQAAIRVGYSEKSAASQASRLLTNANVATALSNALNERNELAKVNAAWVLKRLAMLADFNIEKFIVHTTNGDAFYNFSNATTDDWYCISELTVKTVRRGGDPIPVEEVKLKAYDKLRALDLVGKHTNVQAFLERVEHSGNIQVTKVERSIIYVTDTNGGSVRPAIDAEPV